jgi:hypothetical protein
MSVFTADVGEPLRSVRLSASATDARAQVDAVFTRVRDERVREATHMVPEVLRSMTEATTRQEVEAEVAAAHAARQTLATELERLESETRKAMTRLATAEAKLSTAREKANALLDTPLREYQDASAAVRSAEHRRDRQRVELGRAALSELERLQVRRVFGDLEDTLLRSFRNNRDTSVGVRAALDALAHERSEVGMVLSFDATPPLDLAAWVTEKLVRIAQAAEEAEDRERRRQIFEYERTKPTVVA